MKKNKLILLAISVILTITLVFSSAMLVKRFSEYNDANELYEQKQEQYIEVVSEKEETDAKVTQKPPISVDFEGLLKENQDVVGWIYSKGTPINYPVVQTGDNATYLKLGINKQYLISGTNFVDFRNYDVGVDENYIIYGHNMKNQSMFGTVDNYRNQSYYDKHPTMYYLTPDKNWRIDIIAGKIVPFDDMIYSTASNSPNFTKHVQNIIKNSTFKSKTEYTPGDKIVTLSTCSDNAGKTRFILIGKLIEM